MLKPRTFEDTNDTHKDIVVQYMLIQTMFVQEDCGRDLSDEGSQAKKGRTYGWSAYS